MAADIVVNAAAVGQVVTYVAPGLLARAGYRWRFPGGDKPPGEVVLVSVVLSLPLVALFGIWPGEQLASQAEYVASLLLTSLALGYATARLRDCATGQRSAGCLSGADITASPRRACGRRLWGA